MGSGQWVVRQLPNLYNFDGLFTVHTQLRPGLLRPRGARRVRAADGTWDGRAAGRASIRAGSDPIAIIYQTRKQTHSEGEVSRKLSALLALNQALKIVYMHYGAVFTIAEQLRPLGSRS